MADGTAARPLPDPTHPQYALFEPHFRGLAAGRLVVQRCEGCSALGWPPVERCRACGSTTFGAADVSTTGTVYTFTVANDDRGSWFAARVPYGVAVVEVAPSVRVVGAVYGPDVFELGCGLP